MRMWDANWSAGDVGHHIAESLRDGYRLPTHLVQT